MYCLSCHSYVWESSASYCCPTFANFNPIQSSALLVTANRFHLLSSALGFSREIEPLGYTYMWVDVCVYKKYTCICVCFYNCMCCSVLSCFSHVQLCDPVDLSPPGSSVHWIFRARILEWLSMPSSRGPSGLRDQTSISCIFCNAGGFFFFFLPLSLWGHPIYIYVYTCNMLPR